VSVQESRIPLFPDKLWSRAKRRSMRMRSAQPTAMFGSAATQEISRNFAGDLQENKEELLRD
jgi:hypothetical protein